MSKNKIQFQEGYSLFELFIDYGTDKQCRQALFKWKFPDGFVCPECGNKTYCTLEHRHLYQDLLDGWLKMFPLIISLLISGTILPIRA